MITKAELIKFIEEYPDDTPIVLTAKKSRLECFASVANNISYENISSIGDKIFINTYEKTLYSTKKAIVIKS